MSWFLVELGAAMIVYTVRGGASAVIWTDVVQMFVYIAGAGHVGQALARLALPLEFETTIFDDREDLLSGLAGAEDDLREAFAKGPVMVDLREAEVLEGQQPEAVGGLSGRGPARPHARTHT